MNIDDYDPEPHDLTDNQAIRIIDKLGGPYAVAKGIGKHPSTVYRWMYPKGIHDGCGGIIPTKSLQLVMEFARREGILLSEKDVFPFAINPTRKRK
jgi:hypothetical protein